MKYPVRSVLIPAAILLAVACVHHLSPVHARADDPSGVKEEVVKAFQEALKSEKDEIARLYLAKGLTKLAPDNKDAAQELVKGFLSKNEILNAESNKILAEVIPAGPVAVVRALLPLLKHENEVIRRQTADLLARIDPKFLTK